MRSPRANEPTLSWPTLQPIARWTIVVSSVSPERAETMSGIAGRARRAPAPSSVSLSVPRWFGLSSTALAAPQRGGLAHERRIGDEEVVADDLHAAADGAREARRSPAASSSAERILDRDDRVARRSSAAAARSSASRVELARLEAERVAAAAAELGGGDVERDRDLVAGNEAGALDRGTSVSSACLVAREVGPPAAFVGDAGSGAALLHERARVAVDLRRPFERLGEGRARPGRRP